jgi:hypothetical protein
VAARKNRIRPDELPIPIGLNVAPDREAIGEPDPVEARKDARRSVVLEQALDPTRQDAHRVRELGQSLPEESALEGEREVDLPFASEGVRDQDGDVVHAVREPEVA